MSVSGLQADVKIGHAPCWCAQQWPVMLLSGLIEPLARVRSHFESCQAQQRTVQTIGVFLQRPAIYIMQCHSATESKLRN